MNLGLIRKMTIILALVAVLSACSTGAANQSGLSASSSNYATLVINIALAAALAAAL